MGPIRNKLLTGLGLLLVMLGALAASGLSGVYSYRELVKNLRNRADELPLASQLARKISDLRVIVAGISQQYLIEQPPVGEGHSGWVSEEFQEKWANKQFQESLQSARQTLAEYSTVVEHREATAVLLQNDFERTTAAQLQTQLQALAQLTAQPDWLRDATIKSNIRERLEYLQSQAEALPGHLHYQLGSLADTVRSDYHMWLGVNWLSTAAACGLLAAFLYLFYRWVFRPLSILVAGSRRVAAGDFQHRIQLHTRDEMAELAEALNHMTARFQEIRDDLDRQVQERTKQVVRGEQLASVGFLAAGVAHEINNPLASIAMCAESLEGRIRDILPENPTEAASDSPASPMASSAVKANEHESARAAAESPVILQYLRMIQTEAFRCKEITEKLLDFSRLGNARPQMTDLRQLVQGVVQMVKHLGKYQDRQIEILPHSPAEPVHCCVVVPEIKQVVLNLITNALDCTSSGGKLTIEVRALGGPRLPTQVKLIFTDDGCGMTEEVQRHLFEPFFTRKRQGQGTGLGLSISYRIVTDHGGTLDAASPGPGLGSRFTVTLPVANKNTPQGSASLQESSHRHQAA
ncbi:MAG: HAMP domain-containing sensor histidine kinase [Pirellulales bacterium]|nr:HAMP domain-containing sensor histidine kinase [Pirellulales bacterium]